MISTLTIPDPEYAGHDVESTTPIFPEYDAVMRALSTLRTIESAFQSLQVELNDVGITAPNMDFAAALDAVGDIRGALPDETTLGEAA